MRHLFASLSARLVVTVVALVVLVAVLIGIGATAALHAQLNRQIDHDLERSSSPLGRGFPPAPGAASPRDRGALDLRGRGPQSLVAMFDTDGGRGSVIGFRPGDQAALDAAQLAVLSDVPADGSIHRVGLPGLGDYRVLARGYGEAEAVQVTGLPTEQADAAVSSLIGWEALLIGLGALLALGGGLLLVRRQLRPLTEVAATAHRVAGLPLAEGAIDLGDRVPAHLTDEHTEVGQVGAALNTLLAHVETSLEARHRSEQQARQFLADASHELRTPLATISGYTELARRRPDGDNVTVALAKVEEESARMASLVEDMLLLARLDAGRPLEREPVDLTRLLLEAVSDARVVGPDHRWQLELLDSPVEVTGDEQRLHQVVTNLLSNARRHTPPGTTVTVSVRPDGFDVHDDGPGFPPDFVDHAFQRFARVDQGRTRDGGAGLGLALVQAIVRSHGGTVTITSAPGGTTIAVRLR